MAYPGRGVCFLARASNWNHLVFLEGQCVKGLWFEKHPCVNASGSRWPPLTTSEKAFAWSLAVSDWACTARLWQAARGTPKLGHPEDSRCRTCLRTGKAKWYRAGKGTVRIWGSSPLNNLHQKVWKAQARVARDPAGLARPRASTRQTQKWPGLVPTLWEERDPDSAVI